MPGRHISFFGRGAMNIVAAVIGLLLLLGLDACAQGSGMMVYLGDLGLAASPGLVPGNGSNNTTIEGAPSLVPIDLSGYASDRAKNNLTGYRNILYPLSESRGFTATVAGGGGGGGCGCGG